MESPVFFVGTDNIIRVDEISSASRSGDVVAVNTTDKGFILLYSDEALDFWGFMSELSQDFTNLRIDIGGAQ